MKGHNIFMGHPRFFNGAGVGINFATAFIRMNHEYSVHALIFLLNVLSVTIRLIGIDDSTTMTTNLAITLTGTVPYAMEIRNVHRKNDDMPMLQNHITLR